MKKTLGLAIIMVIFIFTSSPTDAHQAVTRNLLISTTDYTINVNTTADESGSNSSACSLREAIQTFNNKSNYGGCPYDGTSMPIIIQLGAYTYTLTGAASENNNVSGDLDISGFNNTALTIQGQGKQETIIDGANLDRVIDVHMGTSRPIVIQALRIQNGLAPSGQPGGGLSFAASTGGDLTLKDVNVSNNHVSNGSKGGGIYNAGTLELIESVIANNHINEGVSAGEGGGIYNENGGSITTHFCTIRNNHTNDVLSPAALANTGTGGGIFNDVGATMVIGESTINNNRTGDCAQVSFTLCNAGFGGGIRNSGNLVINNSTISYNRTGNAIGDEAWPGGGIYNDAELNIFNSTITGNSIGSGDDTGVRGGGIYNVGSTDLRNSIIADNLTDSEEIGVDCWGTINSLDYNLIGVLDVTECPFTGITTHNIYNTEAHLLPLDTYGGYTDTQPPMWFSPAIDAGPPASDCPPNDQRFFPRPFDFFQDGVIACDIGAVEYDALLIFLPMIIETP
jgi:CSLREA domain-containing protein